MNKTSFIRFANTGRLTRRKNELAPRKQVNVKMKNRLPAVAVGVYHDTITVLGKFQLPGDRRGRNQKMPEQLLVRPGRLIKRIDVLTRNNQYMDRRLRAEIVERDAPVVPVHQLCRHTAIGNFAENTVAHQMILFNHMCRLRVCLGRRGNALFNTLYVGT